MPARRPPVRSKKPRSQRPRRPQRSRGSSQPVELLYLPGLGEVVQDEVRQRLPNIRWTRPVPERTDSLLVDYSGPLDHVLGLRTIVAPFLVLTFAVPRPRALLGDEHSARIVEAMRLVVRLNRGSPPRSFRFEAAGRTSEVFRRLGTLLEEATGLRYDLGEGDLVLRFRRAFDGSDGWDVLVRLSTRPLSDRPWRVRNFPGAVNATIAAAVARLTSPRPSDRVANLMCGSGSLLIERLLDRPAQSAVGVDNDRDVLAACRENVRAAGLGDQVTLVEADIAGDSWLEHGPFDVVLADPPWGTLVGSHEINEELHMRLLERSHLATAPGARLAVLTHEVRMMERCLDRVDGLWKESDVVRVFQKGHHPRIYILSRL